MMMSVGVLKLLGYLMIGGLRQENCVDQLTVGVVDR